MNIGRIYKRKKNKIIDFFMLAPLVIMLIFHIRYFNLDIFKEPLALSLLTTSTVMTFLGVAYFYQIRRQKILMLIWAFLWGGIVSTNLSFLISINFEIIEEGIFFAAFLEEFIKFLGLCFLYLKAGINKFHEYIAFGSVIGLGFYFFEYMEFLIYGYPIEVSIINSTIFLFPHMLLTGIFGAASAYYFFRYKIILSVFFLFSGCIVHYLWNMYVGLTANMPYIFAYTSSAIYVICFVAALSYMKKLD